jgi:mRNA interferase MazF
LVLSDKKYNARSELMLLCPITSQFKPYPFVVALAPNLLPKPSYVLADQVKSLDWTRRNTTFITRAPAASVQEVSLLAAGIVQGRN